MAYFSASMSMYPKSHASNLPYNSWYPSMNYHHPSGNGQFIDAADISTHPAAMYYSNPHIFHQQPSPDWNPEFGGSAGVGAPSGGLQPSSMSTVAVGQSSGPLGSNGGAGGSSAVSGGTGGSNEVGHNNGGLPSLPSPPATLSGGSEMSSPGGTHEDGSPQAAPRPNTNKSPFQWMTKNPQPPTGK